VTLLAGSASSTVAFSGLAAYPYDAGVELGVALNASLTGPAGAPVLMFVHGFGCGQAMWRHVAPAFQATHRVLLLDLPGSGEVDPAAYDPQRHAALDGYAGDLVNLLDELGLHDVTVVGHSVAATMGILAHLASPEVVTGLVLVSPSARYIDDDDYRGGFAASDIEDLLRTMEQNHLGWQSPLSGLVAGDGREVVRVELEQSFCRTDPEIAAQFADVTFRADNRSDLQRVTCPTLVLQVRDDVIAPVSAGEYVHEHIAGSHLRVLETRGHAPHVSDPAEVVAAIAEFVGVPAHR